MPKKLKKVSMTEPFKGPKMTDKPKKRARMVETLRMMNGK